MCACPKKLIPRFCRTFDGDSVGISSNFHSHASHSSAFDIPIGDLREHELITVASILAAHQFSIVESSVGGLEEFHVKKVRIGGAKGDGSSASDRHDSEKEG